MKKHARLSEHAKNDLADIWFYIAKDNEEAARRFIEKILVQCQRLAETPGIGRERVEITRGLRGFSLGNYIIFYREADIGVEVTRVISGFRDIPNVYEE